MGTLRSHGERLGRSAWFRGAVAVMFVALHLFALVAMGRERLGVPFDAAPSEAPAFEGGAAEAMTTLTPARWSRLVVARWDAQHYIGAGLRGFANCPKKDLRTADLAAIAPFCDFSFYPAYGFVGRALTFGGRFAIDYAMLAVSLVSSVTLLFLWTGPAITRALGVGTTYLSLALFNVFPTGFTLAVILTEPLTLALTMGSFVTLTRRWYFTSAVLAGAASVVRVSGVAAGAAVGFALLVSLVVDRPQTPWAWGSRLAAMPLVGWGLAVMTAFYARRYSDPLLYFHSHEQAYRYLETPLIADRLKPEAIFKTLSQPSHEGVWLVVCVVVLAAGMGRAMRGFQPIERAFWSGLVTFALFVGAGGSWRLGFLGMNRYWLMVVPLFFALAVLLRRKPVAAAIWVAVCAWNYWNVEACDFVAQRDSAHICKFVSTP